MENRDNYYQFELGVKMAVLKQDVPLVDELIKTIESKLERRIVDGQRIYILKGNPYNLAVRVLSTIKDYEEETK